MSPSALRNTLAAFALLFAVASAAAPTHAAPSTKLDPAIAATIKAFEQAFNAHNAQTINGLWTTDAVYNAPAANVQVKGREGISAAYAQLFKQQPTSSLKLTINESKIDSAKATLLGIAEVTQKGQLPTRSLFRATLTKVDAGWFFSDVEEAELPADSPTGMSQLAWLAGTWTEALPSGDVKNTYHWVNGGAFMVRNYSRAAKQGPAAEGTQIFGWDAEQQCVRTWLFDSNSSFGEGYWQRQGPDTWINKMALKLPDGRRGSSTQIMTRKGDNEIILQSVDREIDGEFQPNTTPATMTRQTAAKSAANGGQQ